MKESVSDFYKPIEHFYGITIIENILNEVKEKSKGIYLLSQNTPVLTNIKINDKEIYNSFDKITTILLYEYYFLSVFIDYIYLTKDAKNITRIIKPLEDDQSSMFSTDYLIEKEMRLNEEEQEYLEGNVMKVNQEIAKLIVSYLQIMIRSKKTINVSYSNIYDKIFKLKEAEKYDFTDKLKDMSDDARNVDTILKHFKLGPLYSLGMSKGIKEYDPDHFEHDKQIAENVAKIQSKLKKSDDTDFNDEVDEMITQNEIDEDLAINMNYTDDYNDGDPWNEETENQGDYD
jgi:hypothetical protein